MINIIPRPKFIKMKNTVGFCADDSMRVSLRVEEADTRINRLLKKVFNGKKVSLELAEDYKGFSLLINTSEPFVPAAEILAQTGHSAEGYYLVCENNCMIVYSRHIRGFFYGIQTLRQIIENHAEFPACEIIDCPDIKMRGAHFDLRLSHPTFENLTAYIEEFAKYKINTLLIEYEDRFSFDRHPELRNKQLCLTDAQLDAIKQTAADNFIEIIPLQQSFGHLEYVLKHKQYEHLRENHESVGELCPSKPETAELVKSLLDEVIDKHPDAAFIHIGCDEVYSLCVCPACISQYGNSRERAFIGFVNQLIDHVASRGKIPIIWHDMMEKCSDAELSLLDKRAVVMIWLYYVQGSETDIETAERFRANGIEVMGGCAARCSDNDLLQSYPVLRNRVPNIMKWAKSAKELAIGCVIGTNWGVNFSMGCPYGIFETSWYMVLLSAEALWNASAGADGFLCRFLIEFHGLSGNEAAEYLDTDMLGYYRIIGGLADKLGKNRDLAELIGIMNEYGEYARHVRNAASQAYRLAVWPDDEVEKLIYKNSRYLPAFEALEGIKIRMREKLACYLPDPILRTFMESRFYLIDRLREYIKGL